MALAGHTLATINDFIGRELRVSNWITVNQERINEFAQCTGPRPGTYVFEP